MLLQRNINAFQSQEQKPYKQSTCKGRYKTRIIDNQFTNNPPQKVPQKTF